MSDKIVIPLDEGQELLDGEIIEVEEIPDKEYDILDIDIDMNINIDIEETLVTQEIKEQAEEDILADEAGGIDDPAHGGDEHEDEESIAKRDLQFLDEMRDLVKREEYVFKRTITLSSRT